jgi:LacI family transcriptional regulator
MTTSRDIARMAGVSQATVSRVLSGSAAVSPPTRQRVLEAMATAGYKPNLLARAMKTQRSDAVGVVVSDLTNPFYPELIEALTRQLHIRDMRLVVWNATTPGSDLAAIDALHHSTVDGLMFTSATDALGSLSALVDEAAPIVLVNRVLDSGRFDRVYTDNVEGGRLVARYVLGHRRRPAVIAGPHSTSTTRDRLRGFVEQSANWGHPGEGPPVVTGEYSHAFGRKAFEQLIPRIEAGIDCLFCLNDIQALGAIDGARAFGIRVPDDIWIVGFDDIDASSWDGYLLTTVRQPIDEMARAAIDLLIGRRDHPEATPTEVVFPPSIVIRSTTNHAPLGRPDV